MTLNEELNAVASELESDAVEILVAIAKRLRNGRALYGDIHLDTDPRDFLREAFEEDADSLVYRAAELVRLGRRLR